MAVDIEKIEKNLTMADKAKAIDTLSFEEALGELETIVRGLESGQTSLENSIAAYERGTALRQHCEKKLRAAQEKIEKLTISTDGSVSTSPLDSKESQFITG